MESFWVDSLKRYLTNLKRIVETPRIVAFFLVFSFLPNNLSHAQNNACFALVSGAMVVDVNNCSKIEPESYFGARARSELSWIKDLDKVGKAQLYDNYRGVLVTGIVVNSKAVKKDQKNSSGALAGETIKIFMPKTKVACKNFIGHRISIELDQKCCTGGSQTPCLLQTSYVAKRFFNSGKAPKDSPVFQNPDDRTEPTTRVQEDADKLYKMGKFDKASVVYSRAFKDGKLNIDGHFRFANSLRNLDRCPMAIKPLDIVNKRFNKGNYWPQNEMIVRQSVLLLARCYAKMNKPAEATLVLNGFLNQPQKYENEIKTALTHKDFGWIRTSKEYTDFKESAYDIINRKPLLDN